jgi:hypothetical protein
MQAATVEIGTTLVQTVSSATGKKDGAGSSSSGGGSNVPQPLAAAGGIGMELLRVSEGCRLIGTLCSSSSSSSSSSTSSSASGAYRGQFPRVCEGYGFAAAAAAAAAPQVVRTRASFADVNCICHCLEHVLQRFMLNCGTAGILQHPCWCATEKQTQICCLGAVTKGRKVHAMICACCGCRTLLLCVTLCLMLRAMPGRVHAAPQWT